MTQSEQLRRHMRSVEAAMRAYAAAFRRGRRTLGGAGCDPRLGTTVRADPGAAPTRGIEMLREKGWPEDILDDIASHADY